LYSTLFPKAKKSVRHGLGLVVGGRGSKQLAAALVALHESRKENKELKDMVETMMARCVKMEDQYSQIMTLFQGRQNEPPSQHTQYEVQDKSQQPNPTKYVVGSQAKV
jgi:hypothetical protein